MFKKFIIILLISIVPLQASETLDTAKSFSVPEWVYNALDVLNTHFPINRKFDTQISRYCFSRIEFTEVLYAFLEGNFSDIDHFDYERYTFKDADTFARLVLEFSEELSTAHPERVKKTIGLIQNLNFVTEKLKKKILAESFNHFPEKELNEVVCLPENKVQEIYEKYQKNEMRRILNIAKDPEETSRFLEKHINEGIIAFRKENYSLAMMKLKLAYTKAPDNPIIHFWVARIYCKKGMFEDAIKRWEKLISLVDTNIRLNDFRAQKERDDVIIEAEEVVKKYPDAAAPRYYLAALYLNNTRQQERAIEEFRRVAEISAEQ